MDTRDNNNEQGPGADEAEIQKQIDVLIRDIKTLNAEKARFARDREALMKMDVPGAQINEKLEGDWQENVQTLIAGIQAKLKTLQAPIMRHWHNKQRFRWSTFCKAIAEGKDNYERWRASGWPEIHIRELQTVSRSLASAEQRPNGAGQAGGKLDTQSLREWAGAERVTLAIVFTDIVGSTALRSQVGDECMNATLEAHFCQGRRFIAKHGGHEIKTTGDGFLAVFHGTEEALDFAIALHSEPGVQAIQIRVGIHVGEVTVKEAEQDVDGGAVHFASRVVGAIRGSEIWLSDQAKQNIERYRANRHSHLKWERREGLAIKDFPDVVLWSLAACAAPIYPVADPFPRSEPVDHRSETRDATTQPSEKSRWDLKKTVAGTVAFLAQLWTCSGWLRPIRAFFHWLGL
jgi:class 3 adenylate cyclase